MMKGLTEIWIFVQIICCLPTCRGRNLFLQASRNYKLTWICQLIEEANVTDVLLQANITVFLPENEAVASFSNTEYNSLLTDPAALTEFLQYSSVPGLMYKHDLSLVPRLQPLTRKQTFLYFSNYTHNGELIQRVNGADVIQSDIEADNGVLHVIDRVIFPTGSDKTVPQYQHDPDLPGITFVNTNLVTDSEHIDLGDFQDFANSTDHFYTVFIANDSSTLSLPESAQRVFLTNFNLIVETIKAHVIEDEVIFLGNPASLPADVPSLHGTVRFSKMYGKLYVENGYVRAEVIVPNIPVRNGVMHVIDRLLYFKYQSLAEKIDIIPNVQISSSLIPLELKAGILLQDDYTLFIPVDMAFTKLPITMQNKIFKDMQSKFRVLSKHVTTSTLDIETLLMQGQVVTMANTSLFITGTFPNAVYISDGVVRARIIEPNIGCTNGFIHLIDTVLERNEDNILSTIADTVIGLNEIQQIMSNYPSIETILRSPGQYTVFLPSSAAIADLHTAMMEELNSGQQQGEQLLLGHIVNGTITDTSLVAQGAIQHQTLNGKTVTMMWMPSDTLQVTGSRIELNIIMSDIWCSNGIIHIIDGLLHWPTKNASRHLASVPDLSIANNLFHIPPEINANVAAEDGAFTFFIPSNDGFAKLPKIFVQNLAREDISTILKGHIVRGKRYLDTLGHGAYTLPVDVGSLYIVKTPDSVIVMNNYVRARVIKSDITLTNGVMHILDGPLYVPYETVEAILTTHQHARPFYKMVQSLPNIDVLQQDNQTLTVFIPKKSFLKSLSSQQYDTIVNNQEILNQIFIGHVIPDMIVDNLTSAKLSVHSAYNSTFHFRFKQATLQMHITVYQTLAVSTITDMVRCTNGVVYFIDSFLNYSPKSTTELVTEQGNIGKFYNLLLEYVKELNETDGHYTLLLVTDGTLQSSSLMEHSQKSLTNILSRHVTLDSMLPIESLLNNPDSSFKREGVNFDGNSKDIRVTWRSTQGNIISSNLLSSNAIIHIIDTIFYESSPTITSSTSPTSLSTSPVMSHVSHVIKDKPGHVTRTLPSVLVVTITFVCLLLLLS